jgi:hypothetical protein
MALIATDLKDGATYRAKKPIKKWTFQHGEHFNDRIIIWRNDTHVQYDGPAVRTGSKYPKITVEEFLQWAGTEVEDIPVADIEF